MRFIVATVPDVHFSLGRDVILAKTAALYGDETVIFSPTYRGTEPLLDFSSRPVIHQLAWLALLAQDPGFVQGEKLSSEERERRIRDARHRSKALAQKAQRWMELEAMQPLGPGPEAEEHNEIASMTEELAARICEVWSDEKDFVRRAKELRRAQEIGLVRMEDFEEKPGPRYSQARLIASVEQALSSPEAYGYLDERLLPIRNATPAQVEKQRIVHVASEVFQRLPRFEEASFEEIQDIKKELSKYIANFRKGISEISTKIKSAPWDRDFPHEVERELQARLLPEVAAIEDQARSNSYLAELANRVVKNPLALPATSALGIILSTVAHIPSVATQVVSAAAGASLLAMDARKEWKQNQKKSEGNVFFFTYKAGQMLHRKRRP